MYSGKVAVHPKLLCISLIVIAILLNTFSFCLILAKYKVGWDAGKLLLLFDVSLERNIPTFFTVLLMLMICILTLFVALLFLKNNLPFVSKWLVLAMGFLYMAYDEGWHVHEALVAIVREMLWQGRLGVFYYAWVIPGIIVVLFLYLYFFRFLNALPNTFKLFFLSAAGIYLSGCIGMEMVGGYYDELFGHSNPTYNLISTIEETLEMTGLILFIYSLFAYVKTVFSEVTFIIRS